MGRIRAGSDVFRALADPTRRRLVDLLASGDKPVRELMGPFTISQPALSQHLQMLRDAGLVVRHGSGRQQRYSLDPGGLRELIEWTEGHSELAAAETSEPRAGDGADGVAGGLPPAPDELVGRDRELRTLTSLLAEHRLVTLTGPSGVGKTRLAAELAGRATRWGGARWVELAAATDRHAVWRAVAASLELREQSGRPPLEAITAHLRDQRLLLVLDNCEHVVEAGVELASRLLGDCPGVTLLATSQAPLSLDGERVWPVPSLQLPDAGAEPAAVAASEAGRLFRQRAAGVRRGFRLTPESAPVVAEICRRLEGIPLAIELAAARVAVLTPAEILSRLDHRLTVLATSTNGVGRHRSLQAALDWTHALLPPPERQLLRRLSVFSEGCTLAAVQAVCQDARGGADAVLDPLAGLVSKSLVTADTLGQTARYRMLETIRLYAAERLEAAGETARLRRRHAEWFTRLAESAEPELTGRDQLAWLARLEADQANLRAALAWSTVRGRPPLASRLAGALVPFWRVRGLFHEGRGWLEAALARDGGANAAARARALRGAGFMALMLDDSPAAVPLLEQSLRLIAPGDDPSGRARALLLLGNATSMADQPVGHSLYEESVALARRAGDPWCLGHALAMLGRDHLARGSAATARPLLEESIGVARQAGELQGLRLGLHVLGNLAMSTGDDAAAEELLTEGLAITRTLGEPFDIAAALQTLGQLAARRGDPALARSRLEQALVEARQTGKPRSMAVLLTELGDIALGAGDPAGARRLFEESAAATGAMGLINPPALQGLGQVLMAEGDTAGARRLFTQALDLARRRDYKQAMARTLVSLGRLCRAEGELVAAAEHQHAALALRRELGDPLGWAESLEALAGLAADVEAWPKAARLLAAAGALRKRHGYPRPRDQRAGHRADAAAIAAALDREELAAARREGAAMSGLEAVDYAEKLRGSRLRPKHGWDSLSRTERRVADLVAEGLTNRRVAERLFVSRSTVEGHMSSIFRKLDLESRAQLMRLALERRERPENG